MSSTEAYYNRHARQFVDDTLDVDMGSLYAPFLAELPVNAHILDAGCGSGRDALAFQNLGHQISAFDASEQLAGHASQLLGVTVPVKRFDEVEEIERYDGIWACASLLHVPARQLPDVFARLWRALRSGGVLYCSFKQGQGERQQQGRHFTDADETRIAEWTQALPGLSRTTCWLTVDQRPGRDEQWLNVLLSRDGTRLRLGQWPLVAGFVWSAKAQRLEELQHILPGEEQLQAPLSAL